jgi:hypothetical protein
MELRLLLNGIALKLNKDYAKTKRTSERNKMQLWQIAMQQLVTQQMAL